MIRFDLLCLCIWCCCLFWKGKYKYINERSLFVAHWLIPAAHHLPLILRIPYSFSSSFCFQFLEIAALISFQVVLRRLQSTTYIYANIKTKRILLLVFFLLLRLCFRSHMQTHTHTSSHTRSHTISSQSFNSSSYFDWCSCCCCFYCFLFLQYNVLDILMCMYKCS